MFTEPIVLSIIGGLLYQLLPIIENLNGRYNKNKPSQLNSTTIITILFFCCSAGVVSYVYFDGIVYINKMAALQIGATTPLIIRNLGSTIPKIFRKDG